MNRGLNGFAKGVMTGVVVGSVVGSVAATMKKNRNKSYIKKNAGKAINAVGDFVDNMRYIFK